MSLSFHIYKTEGVVLHKVNFQVLPWLVISDSREKLRFRFSVMAKGRFYHLECSFKGLMEAVFKV